VDSQLALVLVNAGVAGVVLILICFGILVPKSVVTDLRSERDELKTALSNERDRADAAVAAASATRDILAAIQFGQRTTGPSQGA